MGVSICILLCLTDHYGRRPLVGRILARTPTSAPTPAPACRQFGRDGLEFSLEAGGPGPDRRLIRPVLWIQTLQALEESDPVLWRPRPAPDALQQVCMTLPQPGGFGGAQHGAEDRLVGDGHGRFRRERRPARR